MFIDSSRQGNLELRRERPSYRKGRRFNHCSAHHKTSFYRYLHDDGRRRASTRNGMQRTDDAQLGKIRGNTISIRSLLARRQKAAAGLSFPRRQGGFHLWCHTYGTWLYRYGQLDRIALTRTGRWADPRSADRYRHGDVSEESRRADWLPVEGKAQRRR